MLSEEDAMEQTLSQPNIDEYANPIAAPIAVIIIVIFIYNYNDRTYYDANYLKNISLPASANHLFYKDHFFSLNKITCLYFI